MSPILFSPLIFLFVGEKTKATPLKFNSEFTPEKRWLRLRSSPFGKITFSGENSQEKTLGGPIVLWARSSKLPAPFTLQQSDGNPPQHP